MKAAKGGRRMQGLAQFSSCFKFIHQWGKRGTEGGIGLALSFIFHVEGWNNVNISFSLKLYKSSTYYSNSPGHTRTHGHTRAHTQTIYKQASHSFSCHTYACVFVVVTAWTDTLVLIKQRPLNTLADPAVISPKQVLWLTSAVSRILTLG